MSAFSQTRSRPTATLTESITAGGAKRPRRPYDTDVTRLLPRWLLVTVIVLLVAAIVTGVVVMRRRRAHQQQEKVTVEVP